MSTYFVVIDDAVAGPYEVTGLQQMAGSGLITEATLVKRAEGSDAPWIQWSTVPRPLADRLSLATSTPPQMIEHHHILDARESLRRLSAYGRVRGLLDFVVVLDFLGAAICVGFGCFEGLPLYFIAAFVCVLSIIFPYLGSALLDIADSLLLEKVERERK